MRVETPIILSIFIVWTINFYLVCMIVDDLLQINSV
jgi:hypothetical protein